MTPPGPEPETKYTVTFVYDDGTTANQTKKVDKDSNVDKPADPTREGYAFKGWYEDGATAAFDFDTPITKNITLKAEWAKVYTVTFEVDGTAVSTQKVEDGNKAVAPATAPTKTGYRFTGWYEDGAEEAFDFGTAITKNITLKASWIKTYTVTFNTGSNYASPVNSITVDENSKINKPETNRPGFRFDGWWNSDGGEEFNFKDTQINTDYTLVAVWTPLFIVKNGVLEPTEVGKTLENVVIPESIDGSPVTEIKNYAFQNKQGIVSVEIPSTVTKIGKFAFNICTGITSVTFGEGSKLGTIGESAFDGCTAITSFKIPASVTMIEKSAFSGCSSMEFVTFSTDSKLTTIGVYAFSNCSGITSLEIPTSVTTIGYGAFRQCNSMTEIVIPSSVTNVGDYAFLYCIGLSSLKIESNESTYGTSAFESCTSLKSIQFPEKMTSDISTKMFYGCTTLAQVDIPDDVRVIGDSAFGGCTSLKKAYVPEEALRPANAFPDGCDVVVK